MASEHDIGGPSGKYVGRRLRRIEDARLIAGRGRYLADLATRDTLHGAFVRSTQAHARLGAIDVEAALGVAGVLAVLTGNDLPVLAAPLPALATPDPIFAAATNFASSDARLPCLPTERVHYVGQAIAVVVATSRRIAEDAAELVEVQYEPLPAVLDASFALSPDAPVIHPHLQDNEAAHIVISFGDLAEARERAALVVADQYRVGRHGAAPLECRGVMALVDDRRSRIEVWTSTQIPHLVRQAICAVTGWEEDDVRVSAPEVGGGFGTKANVYAEEIVLPVVAKALRRNVIWSEDRLEHLTASAQGRDQEHHASLAVDEDGLILAWEDDFVVDVGAGSLWTAGIIANTAIHLMGPYRIPAFRASGRAAYTTKTIVAQFRGAGRPEACFALERSLDRAADKLGLSRIEIRRRNLLAEGEFPYSRPVPYRDGVPIRYDGRDYRACLDACLDLLPEGAAGRLQSEHSTMRIGHGVAAYIEATGRGPWETGRVLLTPAGRFEVAAGCASAGQGHETTLAQIAADILCVSPTEIHVVVGDTDAIAEGMGTFASRSMVTAGNAVAMAAERLVDKARTLAAARLGTDEDISLGVEGFATPNGGSISWKELAEELKMGGLLAEKGPLEGISRYEPATVTWTMGVHAAVVSVDPETGLCRLLQYAVAHEGGVEINPSIVEGQILGGVAQGIGGALLEEFGFDSEGQPLSATMADYLLPGPGDVPPTKVIHLPAATPANALGVRGVGESGTIAAYAAIASAIEAALNYRIQVKVTPISPASIVSSLELLGIDA